MKKQTAVRPPIIIRAATAADVKTLVRFSAAMALETEGRRLDQNRLRKGIEGVLNAPARGFYKVAELTTRTSRAVVGQLLVTFEWSDWRNATFWWIQSVYVDPAWRRKGVYRTMHEIILEEARQGGDICGVRLYVEGDNAVAKAVYKKVGLSASSYHVFESDFMLRKAGRTPRARNTSGT
ncbi:MAG: GNAT family N-acetyltransferase [Nitrospira sp.]|nr:GNAT family N-acetyltransferase [Nitrospira sp.]